MFSVNLFTQDTPVFRFFIDKGQTEVKTTTRESIMAKNDLMVTVPVTEEWGDYDQVAVFILFGIKNGETIKANELWAEDIVCGVKRYYGNPIKRLVENKKDLKLWILNPSPNQTVGESDFEVRGYFINKVWLTRAYHKQGILGEDPKADFKVDRAIAIQVRGFNKVGYDPQTLKDQYGEGTTLSQSEWFLISGPIKEAGLLDIFK